MNNNNTMNTPKPSRASQRRFNQRVRDLKELLSKNEKWFVSRWNNLVNDWIHEIHNRAEKWQNGQEYRNVSDKSGIVEKERHLIFGVVEIAECLLAKCGNRAEVLVGTETRRVLNDECVKAIARVCGKEFASNFTQHWYRWAKN